MTPLFPHRHFLTLLTLALAALLLTGCLPGFRSTPTPMPTLHLVQRTPPGPCTAVMLPGMLDSAETFKRQEFADLAAELAPGLDVVAADAHFGYYRKRTVLARLEGDVVTPLQERGSRVWLVGTSLGGIGSVLYARGWQQGQRIAGADRLEGLVLIAPFLGDEDILDEIEAAGGPLAWRPESSGEEAPDPQTERRAFAGHAAWAFLVDWHRRSGDPGSPRILLAWGDEDDFARAGQLAAPLLPETDVFIRPGGHDWKTWRQLWRDVLEAGVFDGCG